MLNAFAIMYFATCFKNKSWKLKVDVYSA